jgi:hypothetical protein
MINSLSLSPPFFFLSPNILRDRKRYIDGEKGKFLGI